MIYAYKTNAMFLCFFNCQIDCVINDNHGVIFMTIHKSRYFCIFFDFNFPCVWSFWNPISNQLDNALIITTKLSVQKHFQNTPSFFSGVPILKDCLFR